MTALCTVRAVNVWWKPALRSPRIRKFQENAAFKFQNLEPSPPEYPRQATLTGSTESLLLREFSGKNDGIQTRGSSNANRITFEGAERTRAHVPLGEIC